MKLSGARNGRPLGISVEAPSSFASGPGGTIYITSLTGGKLYRFIPE